MCQSTNNFSVRCFSAGQTCRDLMTELFRSINITLYCVFRLGAGQKVQYWVSHPWMMVENYMTHPNNTISDCVDWCLDIFLKQVQKHFLDDRSRCRQAEHASHWPRKEIQRPSKFSSNEYIFTERSPLSVWDQGSIFKDFS